jgi:hypothetical protein
MDSNNFLFAIGLGSAFNLLLLYLIIGAATKAHKRALYEWAQLDLLSKIAKAQGVPDEDISATFEAAGLAKRRKRN